MFLDNVNTVFDLHTRNACLVIADVSLLGCLDGNPIIKPMDIGAAMHNYCCLANACMNWFPSIEQPITLPGFLGNFEIGSSSQ